MADVMAEISAIKGLCIGLERSLRKNRQSPATAARRQLIRGLSVVFVHGVRGEKNGATYEQTVKQMYPKDYGTLLHDMGNPAQLIRAATAPAMTTNPGWAGELVPPEAVSGLLLLAPQSLAAQLGALGLQIDGTKNTIFPTGPAAETPSDPFVGEGMPIDVRQGLLSSVTLIPKKAAFLATFTNELAKRSTPTIEAVIENVLSTDISRGLDMTLVSASAGDLTHPPGLLHDAVEISASDSTDPATAAAEDISNLAAALAGPGRPQRFVMIVNPKQAVSLALLYPGSGLAVLQSDQVPVGMVVGVDAGDFILMGSPTTFTVDLGRDAVIHASDDAQALDGLTATPERSLWQTNCSSVRIVEFVDWALKMPAAVTADVSW
jgi:HK97 family phage major capsid protein